MNADKRGSVYVRDVHCDLPNAILLLPNADITAVLDYFLRFVCDFVSAVRIAEILPARCVARYRLPRHLALSFSDRFRRRFTSDKRQTVCTIEANVSCSILAKSIRQPVIQSRRRILAIAIKQCLTCMGNARQQGTFLLAGLHYRLPMRLWPT